MLSAVGRPTSWRGPSELRRLSAGFARWNRWCQLLPDGLAQFRSRTHGGTGVPPNHAYQVAREARSARAAREVRPGLAAPP